jgi:hypothetical protein
MSILESKIRIKIFLNGCWGAGKVAQGAGPELKLQ